MACVGNLRLVIISSKDFGEDFGKMIFWLVSFRIFFEDYVFAR